MFASGVQVVQVFGVPGVGCSSSVRLLVGVPVQSRSSAAEFSSVQSRTGRNIGGAKCKQGRVQVFSVRRSVYSWGKQCRQSSVWGESGVGGGVPSSLRAPYSTPSAATFLLDLSPSTRQPTLHYSIGNITPLLRPKPPRKRPISTRVRDHHPLHLPPRAARPATYQLFLWARRTLAIGFSSPGSSPS